MPFEATSEIYLEVYKAIKRAAAGAKVSASRMSAKFAAEGASYDDLFGLYVGMVGYRDSMQASIDSVNQAKLIEFARLQEGNDTYDPVSEFVTMRTAINALLTQMESDIPTDNRTVAEVSTWANEGAQLVTDTFPVGATATIRTRLNAIDASIS